MKKIVILMLALMLTLTSVSAMAANLNGSGTATESSTLTTTLRFELPESFEWSIPDVVTVTDEAFGDTGMKAISPVINKDVLAYERAVKCSVPTGRFEMTETTHGNRFEAEFTYGEIKYSHTAAQFSREGAPLSFMLKAYEPSNGLLAGTYEAQVTVTAQIVDE